MTLELVELWSFLSVKEGGERNCGRTLRSTQSQRGFLAEHWTIPATSEDYSCSAGSEASVGCRCGDSCMPLAMPALPECV